MVGQSVLTALQEVLKQFGCLREGRKGSRAGADETLGKICRLVGGFFFLNESGLSLSVSMLLILL